MQVSARDHSLGSERAELTLVDYGDYACPFCKAAQMVVRAVRAEYGSRLRYVYRHFPHTTMHPLAAQAAELAEAAGAQGAFWEMHHLLFAAQPMLDLDDLLHLAATLDLDLDRVVADLGTNRYLLNVQEDVVGGARSGVFATPTFFINGERYDGSWDFTALTAALDRARPRSRPIIHH